MFKNLADSYKQRQAEKARLHREALEDQVVQAEQVRNFFATDIGQYILKKMDEDIATVKSKLVRVDHRDANAVQDLQVEFQVINKVKLYLGKAILAGEQAERALNLKESYDVNDLIQSE